MGKMIVDRLVQMVPSEAGIVFLGYPHIGVADKFPHSQRRRAFHDEMTDECVAQTMEACEIAWNGVALSGVFVLNRSLSMITETGSRVFTNADSRGSGAVLEAPAFVAGLDDVAVAGEAIE